MICVSILSYKSPGAFWEKSRQLINWKIIADCILTSQRARLWKVKFDKESFLCVLFFFFFFFFFVVGSARQECNLKLKLDMKKMKIPVVFHNLRGYDSHFITDAKYW